MADKQSHHSTGKVEKSTSGKISKGMDSYNKKAMNVLVNKGHNAFVKHCFTHPKTGKPMSYSDMRGFYG